jgi:hypothetical protein
MTSLNVGFAPVIAVKGKFGGPESSHWLHRFDVARMSASRGVRSVRVCLRKAGKVYTMRVQADGQYLHLACPRRTDTAGRCRNMLCSIIEPREWGG